MMEQIHHPVAQYLAFLEWGVPNQARPCDEGAISTTSPDGSRTSANGDRTPARASRNAVHDFSGAPNSALSSESQRQPDSARSSNRDSCTTIGSPRNTRTLTPSAKQYTTVAPLVRSWVRFSSPINAGSVVQAVVAITLRFSLRALEYIERRGQSLDGARLIQALRQYLREAK